MERGRDTDRASRQLAKLCLEVWGVHIKVLMQRWWWGGATGLQNEVKCAHAGFRFEFLGVLATAKKDPLKSGFSCATGFVLVG
eukprot:158785-Rhodomonas_salina.1